MRTRDMLKVSALAAFAALSFGCASSGDMRSMQQVHEQDMQSVQASAESAKATADEALRVANEAKAMAAEANARSMATEEKINRMFQKSMMK
ncbi:Lpp/OprI family alanine-zipper lipoprotein [Marinobacterium rhizophilum]|uniref:Lpp/OprI family alanine-zipper lipoprotein n=1 Tax=Marinobacterium rhizophilum TaxID=420402 RepID=UPI0003691DEA|nr:Lpp/OprI family alanine-zipper lipoprotein [Marinobacterium rhizophilum]